MRDERSAKPRDVDRLEPRRHRVGGGVPLDVGHREPRDARRALRRRRRLEPQLVHVRAAALAARRRAHQQRAVGEERDADARDDRVGEAQPELAAVHRRAGQRRRLAQLEHAAVRTPAHVVAVGRAEDAARRRRGRRVPLGILGAGRGVEDLDRGRKFGRGQRVHGAESVRATVWLAPIDRRRAAASFDSS